MCTEFLTISSSENNFIHEDATSKKCLIFVMTEREEGKYLFTQKIL